MSPLCLKRLSYGHWHLNENFQYVFWLQRRIPLESTIKRSFLSSESQSWLCLIIACLAIFRKKYVIFQFWTGKAIKQQSASDNLQKSRSGVQTPLCAPCLETPTLHIFYITRVIHIWLTFSLKDYHDGNDSATISSGCDDDVLCAVVFLWLHQSESGEHKGDWTDSGTLPVLTSAQSQTLGALLASVLREAIVGVCRGRKQVLFSSVVKHTVLETPSSLRHWGPFFHQYLGLIIARQCPCLPSVSGNLTRSLPAHVTHLLKKTANKCYENSQSEIRWALNCFSFERNYCGCRKTTILLL